MFPIILQPDLYKTSLICKNEKGKPPKHLLHRRKEAVFFETLLRLRGFYTRHIGIEVFQHIFVKVATWTTQKKKRLTFLPARTRTNQSFFWAKFGSHFTTLNPEDFPTG